MSDTVTVSGSMLADSQKLKKAFERLADKAENGIVRPILTAASKVVAAAEQADAPRDSGLMAMAVGVSTTRTYKTQGSSKLFIAAGVRWGFRRTVSAAASGKLKIDRASRPASGDDNVKDPAKYLWLVTHGRKAVAIKDSKILYDAFHNRFLGKAVQAAAPDDFIHEAFEAVGPALSATIASQGASAIEREANS
jgi:hypothetical protein